MQQQRLGKLIVPASIVFVIVNCIVALFRNRIDELHIDRTVILAGNCILYVLVLISLTLHYRAAKNEKPSVLVRSIMGSMLIKMLAIGIAVLVYVKITKEKRDIAAVASIMGLYLIYLLIEIKVALQLNKKQPANAGN